MSRRARIAALFRELADAFEAEDAAESEETAKPRRKRPAVLAAPPDPRVHVDEVSRARARRILRGQGIA